MMKSWLRRLPPLRDTLFIRLALLVIMAVLASQIFTLWLTIKQKNELLSRQLYAQVLDTLANYEGVLDTIHISQRIAAGAATQDVAVSIQIDVPVLIGLIRALVSNRVAAAVGNDGAQVHGVHQAITLRAKIQHKPILVRLIRAIIHNQLATTVGQHALAVTVDDFVFFTGYEFH